MMAMENPHFHHNKARHWPKSSSLTSEPAARRRALLEFSILPWRYLQAVFSKRDIAQTVAALGLLQR